MTIFASSARVSAWLASFTLASSPVMASTRTVPITVPLSARPAPAPGWAIANETVNDHRWRGYRRHHDDFDGGDLLTVLLIGGGIAAVATAIGNDRDKRPIDRTDGRAYPDADEDSYRYRSDGTRAPDDYGQRTEVPANSYDYRDGSREPDRGSGQLDDRETDRAVGACSAEAARSGEVDEIFDVAKIDGEWRVKGDYRNGREFTCSVDGTGKAYVGLGDHAANDGRSADDRYATGHAPDFTDPRGR